MNDYNEIKQLAKTLYDLWKQNYQLVEPIVLDIINSRSKSSSLIESYLDDLLNIPTDESYELFKKLCAYYSTIDKEGADFYLNTWNEMYEDDYQEEVKIKKIDS